MTQTSILPKAFIVDGKYTVLLLIKSGNNADAYRVKGLDGKLSFLKLFHNSKLHRTAFNASDELIEIELHKDIKHSNISTYKDSGEIIIQESRHNYLVLDFIVGETLAERNARERLSSVYDIKQYACGILNGLKYLHTQEDPIIHNEVTLQNVMLDLSGGIPKAIIIDFGYARRFNQSSKSYNRNGINPYSIAPECFRNFYSPQSDLFSVGALLYQLIFGLPPWYLDISKYKSDRIKIDEAILEAREKPLSFPDIADRFVDLDEDFMKILKKALHRDLTVRFKSADDFINALNGNITTENIAFTPITSASSLNKEAIEAVKTPRHSNGKKGKGFDGISGMQDLKDQLQTDVIDALTNPEEYEKYGLTIPNGMLLYGPPGCGKTFFSQKFSEEVGFNFVSIKPSDLASIYVHGSQEKIGKLFDEAREKAPSIIFIDELDALVPNREGNLSHSYAGEVNEFLAQMTNCAEDGIFIIGATNRPEKIDPAVLRSGRLDKKIYLAPPDFEARKSMFQLHLKNRPVDFGISYDVLATMTNNYVSSDIELLVNEAARAALKVKERISMEILITTIGRVKPSVSAIELKKYEELKISMEE